MKVLFGPQIAPLVVEIIDASKKLCVLVSPYVDSWLHLEEAVRRAVHVRGVKVILIVRGGKDAAKQREGAQRLVEAGATLRFVDRLHAKLYLNDSVALVTSLNLLRSSMEGSWEMGTLMNARDDKDAIASIQATVKKLIELAKSHEILNTTSGSETAPSAPKSRRNNIQSILDAAKRHKAQANMSNGTPPAARPRSTTGSQAKATKAPAHKGHCIRCAKRMKYNTEKPLCPKCYKLWAKWSDENYEEKYCYACGLKHATSMRKPVCLPCYRMSK